MAVKAKDTPVGAAARTQDDEEVRPVRRPYFTEAMRQDLEAVGWTIDPTTGKKITEDPR